MQTTNKTGGEMIKTKKPKTKKQHISVGDIVLVRGRDSGLTVGKLTHFSVGEIYLKDARRVYYYSGAASVYGLAADGCNADSKITNSVRSSCIFDACEIVIVSDKAKPSLLKTTWSLA